MQHESPLIAPARRATPLPVRRTGDGSYLARLTSQVAKLEATPHGEHFARIGFVDGCGACDRIQAQRIARNAEVRLSETDRLMRQRFVPGVTDLPRSIHTGGGSINGD